MAKFNIKYGNDYSSDLETMIKGLLPRSEVRRPLGSKLHVRNAGFCSRLNVMNSVLTTTFAPSISGKFYVESGSCIEKIYVDLLDENNKVCIHDLKVTDNKDYLVNKHNANQQKLLLDNSEYLGYSGVIDLVMFDHNDELTIVDVKTVGELPEKDSLNYVRQVQMYSAILGVDNAVLLYQSRNIKDRNDYQNPLMMKISKIDTSEDTLLGVVETAFLSKLSIEHKLLPNISYNFKKTVSCKNCDFSNFCWDNNSEGLKVPLVQDLDLEVQLMEQSQKLARKFMEERTLRYQLFDKKFVGSESGVVTKQ